MEWFSAIVGGAVVGIASWLLWLWKRDGCADTCNEVKTFKAKVADLQEQVYEQWLDETETQHEQERSGESMAGKLTTGRALAQQRARIVRKLERQLKQYDSPSVTDATLQAALQEAIAFIRGSAARYNAHVGGLGK